MGNKQGKLCCAGNPARGSFPVQQTVSSNVRRSCVRSLVIVGKSVSAAAHGWLSLILEVGSYGGGAGRANLCVCSGPKTTSMHHYRQYQTIRQVAAQAAAMPAICFPVAPAKYSPT